MSVYVTAIATFGIEAQLGIAQEECAELIQAISKWIRASRTGNVIEKQKAINSVAEEAADVMIMIEQLKVMIGPEIKLAHDRKLNRLMNRLGIERPPGSKL